MGVVSGSFLQYPIGAKQYTHKINLNCVVEDSESKKPQITKWQPGNSPHTAWHPSSFLVEKPQVNRYISLS